MQRKPASYTALLPSAAWLRRAFILFLASAGLILLSMSKSGNPAAERLRTHILDIATPVIAVVASPFDAIAAAGEWVVDFSRTRAENILLKNQNLQLLEWQAQAKRMEAENRALKSLLNVVPAKKHSYISARLVAASGGPFAHSALLAGGSRDGVKADQAVINENGLIGRVVEAGETSARVLLLNDINSRVPVMSERTREKSMLTGTGAAQPVLNYLPATHGLEAGDRLVTSGDGGIFPAGLPVGTVAAVEGRRVVVQPFADISRAEFVSAVQYSF